MLPFCWIRRKNWKTEKGKQTNLERKCNGHAHNEQEEWHYKVSKVAAIPWRMPNHRPLSTSIVNQNHQLHHQEENYAKSKIHKRQQKSRFLPTRTSKKLFLFTVLWHWIEVTKVNYRANLLSYRNSEATKDVEGSDAFRLGRLVVRNIGFRHVEMVVVSGRIGFDFGHFVTSTVFELWWWRWAIQFS